MSFLKRILGGHGSGHGGGHGSGGHGGGHHGDQRRDGHGGHDARGRDRHGWGWQAPADASNGGQGGNRAAEPARVRGLRRAECGRCALLRAVRRGPTQPGLQPLPHGAGGRRAFLSRVRDAGDLTRLRA